MTLQRRWQTEWIVYTGDSEYPGQCDRCGKRLHLPLPQPLNVFIAASKAFVSLHRHCKEKTDAQT
jgi:hypothetical protein